jgi:hypothetical protein
MTTQEVGVFADKLAAHNERIIIILKDKTELRGHFINNPKSPSKTDNHWNFITLKSDVGENTKLELNGDDIESIKKIQLF